MSFSISDSSAKNIYKTMYSYYNGAQMPDNDTGVFFGFANFTMNKLIYCIEFMKRQYGLGWFTSDYNERSTAIAKMAKALYIAFDQTVSVDGIKKFLNWVYSFASKDQDAAAYFSGSSDWSYFDALFKDVSESVGQKLENVKETITYGVNYPVLEKSTPTTGTILKWGVIIGGGLVALHFAKKLI